MRTILVLDDDAPAREELADTLRRLFPQARVIATGVDAQSLVEGDAGPIVLADVAALERIRRWVPARARVVALTREMGPATLLRAEAFGVAASLRTPAGAGHLQAVLEPLLDAASDAGAPGRGGTGSIAAAESRWVETEAALAAVSQRLQAPGELALDTEGDSLHHYPGAPVARAARRLVRRRLAGRSARRSAISRPLRASSPPRRSDGAPRGRQRSRSAQAPWIRLCGDLRHLDRRALSRRQALGLDVLLETYLGVELPPSKQRDDWSRRPLSEAAAALRGGRCPVPLRARGTARRGAGSGGPARLGRGGMRGPGRAAGHRAGHDPDAFAGLKGARDLGPVESRHSPGAVRAARDRSRARLDRPPFKILGEESSCVRPQSPPTDPTGLGGDPGLHAEGDRAMGRRRSVRGGAGAARCRRRRCRRSPAVRGPASRRSSRAGSRRSVSGASGRGAAIRSGAGLALAESIDRRRRRGGPARRRSPCRGRGVRRWRGTRLRARDRCGLAGVRR